MSYQQPQLRDPRQRETDLSDRESLVSGHGHQGKSCQCTAVFNVVNSVIGSGIIGLPYSMKQAGFPLGVLLLFWVSYITDFSLILLIKGGALSGTDSYQSLVNKTFGFPGYLLLSALQFMYPFIAMISYNIITGDTLSKVFQRIPGVDPGSLFIGRHFIIVVSTVTLTLPLSLYRDIAKLGKISLISTILTILILGIVMTRAVSLGPNIPKTEDAWVFAKPNAIQAIGVMSFAFICHHNCFLVYGSLQEPTVAKWCRVIHTSILVSVFICVLFATCGYLTFTGFTQGDLFENYCRSDDLVTFGRFCYGITVILTYPIECFVTREVIANVFFGGNPSSVFHIILTVVIITAAMLVSLLIDCLGIVLELNGALCAAPLIFIIPSACYLKLSEEPRTHADKIMACVMLPVGAVVMVVGFVMAITNPQDCTHGQEMFYCLTSPDNISLTNISHSHLQLTTQPSLSNRSIFQ
ncbi:putative sodium-coupled neutral amino acid transporter 11 isoform X1 [Peromyscus californicus insignis]|uniref:putative sodium-coupled neutral amino acid transporter 11 isoform X1 n=1 Tax=Peromyscus californicus insignis TaxID=564181 RepID=UPI0022A6D88F|nr:putative sodium-coupled neutral amino acid transporter 11 isoform X1 [Peromyscus californicus insignis]